MPEVEVIRDGGVLTILLNRPEVLNALDAALLDGLHAALQTAAGDETVRAVLITGAGSGFCVGQDLGEAQSGTDLATALRARYHRVVLAIRSLEKPVIAAVNGAAAGAGLSLALACDIRIAARSAGLVPAFVKIGLVPDAGATWLAARLLGPGRAFEWLTTSRRLSADEARDWGLVSEVVADEELAERMHEVAHLYAAMPTQAVWRTKRLLDEAETSTFAGQLEREARAQGDLQQTPDFREGLAAFLGKREPAFGGAKPEWPHPVRLVVADDLRRWRLTVALRLLLAYPHLLVLEAWAALALPVSIVNWAIALVRGRPAAGLTAWLTRLVRYQTHVYAYLFLVADPYPSFRGWAGAYPVDLTVDPPGPQARWKTLLRLVLAVPALVFTWVLQYVLYVVAFLGWVFALVTGRYPRGLRDFSAYCLRFAAQTLAYLLFLTDRYPTLENGAAPVTRAGTSA